MRNSLTPVMASSRTAACAGVGAVGVDPLGDESVGERRGSPPASSIAWNSAHPAWASELVSDRRTRSRRRIDHRSDMRLLQQQRLRVARDPPAHRVGMPMAASNGRTVTASAPATPAANAATVVRSMFTYGSRRVIIGHEVTACCSWPC